MYARVTSLTVQPGRLPDLTTFMREEGAPVLRQLPGFNALLVLINRKSDQAMTIALWDSLADVEASAAVSQSPEVIARLGSLMAGPPLRADYEVAIQQGRPLGEDA